ncbi:MAG: DUF2182 domain-containing protein [Gemmatimonadales bacterium]
MTFRPASTVASGRAERLHRNILAGGLLLTGVLWSAMWLTHKGHAALTAASPSLATAGVSALLWMVMMAAMMTPAALPWLGVLAAIPRSDQHSAGPYLRAGSLLLGYLTVWGLFSVLAAAAQLLLLQLALLEPHTLRLGGRAAGGVLLLAGLWELSPVKDACLRRCRSPFGVLLAGWTRGSASGYGIGLRHGLTCLACCWGLMALGFVVGVVSLGWMAVLTAIVCAEKVMPRGHQIPRLLGVALACVGIALLASPG